MLATGQRAAGEHGAEVFDVRHFDVVFLNQENADADHDQHENTGDDLQHLDELAVILVCSCIWPFLFFSRYKPLLFYPLFFCCQAVAARSRPPSTAQHRRRQRKSASA